MVTAEEIRADRRISVRWRRIVIGHFSIIGSQAETKRFVVRSSAGGKAERKSTPTEYRSRGNVQQIGLRPALMTKQLVRMNEEKRSTRR